MDRTQGFRLAVLGILSRADQGLHGWAIKRQCELAFGCVWEVNVGRVYRAIGQLRAAGLIERAVTIDVNDLTRSRKVFRIAARGRQALAGLFADPREETEWARRDEFAALLVFSESGGLSARVHLVEHERQRCEHRLRSVLRKRRTLRPQAPDAVLLSLLIDGAEMEVRARLAWLDRIAAKVQPPCDDRAPSAADSSTPQRLNTVRPFIGGHTNGAVLSSSPRS
jgi:DNA-binding PadR family transcriptional regulator